MAKDAAQRAKRNIVKQNENGKNAKSQKPNKFKTFFKKLADGFRKLRSELKKVTWPDFKSVLTQTGVVLIVTVFFLVVIGCFDLGLSALFGLVNS